MGQSVRQQDSAEPLVSILVPNFNKSSFIAESIQSLLNQTWHNLEVIVVDDGSTDNSLDVLAAMSNAGDPRLHVHASPHIGKVAAADLAFTHVLGAYVKLWGSDDVLVPDAVKTLMTAIPGYEGVVHDILVTDSSLQVLAPHLVAAASADHYYSAIQVVRGAGAPSGCYLFTRALAERVFPIPLAVTYEDWYIAMTIALNGFHIHCLPQSLGSYRQGSDNVFGGVYNFSGDALRFRAARDVRMLDVFDVIVKAKGGSQDLVNALQLHRAELQVYLDGRTFSKAIRAGVSRRRAILAWLKGRLPWPYAVYAIAVSRAPFWASLAATRKSQVDRTR
jgi:glycosyltransferase involved in cell wall biosynthesis